MTSPVLQPEEEIIGRIASVAGEQREITVNEAYALARHIGVTPLRMGWLLRRAGLLLIIPRPEPEKLPGVSDAGDMHRCWDCGEYAPAGVCPGPHDEGAYIRGRSQHQVFDKEAQDLSYRTCRRLDWHRKWKHRKPDSAADHAALVALGEVEE